ELAQAGISSLAGHLRAEVSRVISRRYSPYLRFEVVPGGGWEAAEVVEGADGGDLPSESRSFPARADDYASVPGIVSRAPPEAEAISSMPESQSSRLHEEGG